MHRFSDSLHYFPLGDFQFTGDLNTDIKNYNEDKKISLYNQDLDENNYVFILYRLSFGKNITLHTLTDGVIEKIKHTRIESIPNTIPKFMLRSFLIEARHDKNIFDNIISIGGFTLNNEMFLLIQTKDERFFCQREKMSFDGRNIDDINYLYNQNINYGSFMKQKTRKDIFAFVIILSLMLEAERTPLLIENKKEKAYSKKNNKNNNETEWTTKRIYIDKSIKYKNKSNEHNVFDKNEKELKDVMVTGFLRTQHYGPELSKTKMIYIESFDSTRWTNSKDKKIIVDIYGEK